MFEAFCLFAMHISAFDYDLPDELIAQHPPANRGTSRLLHVDGPRVQDLQFADFLRLIQPGDVMVFNDTRVIKARLFGSKASGGQVEALIERVLDAHIALAHVRASKPPKPGGRLLFAGRWQAEMLERVGDLFKLRFLADENLYEIMAQSGSMPLPPYIARSAGQEDDERYQTVYASEAGAVAAPTAGLHFTTEMLAILAARGVKLCRLTLHVGAGTFQPVRVENIEEHVMHGEIYDIPEETRAAIVKCRAEGTRVLAVGTTSLRALEAAAQSGTLQAGCGETSIFITPGYQFRVVDRLLTNFHLPRSTLLMLVSALAGQDVIRAAYQHAIAQHYRFFSYGDAMLLEQQPCARQG